MPSSTVKQAKTMSAIAHGWKPKGKAKGIPVSVAKDFHAADKGRRYGKGSEDGSMAKFRGKHHSPAGIANNDGYSSRTEGRRADIGGHSRQTHGDDKGGSMVGFAEKRHSSGQGFQAEVREHWGAKASKAGEAARPHRKPPANIDDRGGGEGKAGHTKLVHETNSGHLKQPHRGDPTGAGRNAVAEHHVGHVMSREPSAAGHGNGVLAAASRRVPAHNAHAFRGTQKCGVLRVSGHSGAHQIGCKKR